MMDGFDPHASLMKIRGTSQDSSPGRSDYRKHSSGTFSISSHKASPTFSISIDKAHLYY